MPVHALVMPMLLTDLPRCDHCPVAPDRLCRGALAGMTLCHRPEYVALFLELATETPEMLVAKEARQKALLARVAACLDRGSVLPVSMQDPSCGCGELSECRAGKGKIPGRVGLATCLECVGASDQ